VTPWTSAAEDRGAAVQWVDLREEDCTLDLDDLEQRVGPRTRLVACGLASNAVGTVNDVRAIARVAHRAGALCFVDAVQFVPHGLVDVRALDCDLLACSAYKFFGPHVGVLHGRADVLARLRAYKVRPASDAPPHRFETGTQNHEGIAGVLGAVEYLAWLARACAPDREFATRREALAHAMAAIAEHERGLAAALIDGLRAIRGLRIWGIVERARAAERVPTVSFTLDGWHPRRLAERLAEDDIYVWNGNFYALAVMERLGLEERGGMLRVGLAHYNTRAEVDTLLDVLSGLAAKRP
jgi:cysteine desulfurase family protein (TIGR01976 family)